VQKGIDTDITNVDPIKYPDPRKTADETINEDFLTAKIDDKFNEIWAFHSLPLYLVEPDDVSAFYSKALELLADNGVLRIYPICSAEEDINTMSDTQCSLSIREWLLKPLVHKESLERLQYIKSNQQHHATYYLGGVTIQKKPQTT